MLYTNVLVQYVEFDTQTTHSVTFLGSITLIIFYSASVCELTWIAQVKSLAK